MTNRNEIDLEKKVFRKYISKDRYHKELQRSILVDGLGSKTDLFKTLNVLGHSDENCKIEFQIIEPFSFRKSYLQASRFFCAKEKLTVLKELFVRLGEVLAYIHSIKPVSSADCFPKGFFEDRFNKQTDEVFIHGDFTMNNIFIYNNEFTIIDWNTSSLFDFHAEVGPAYWDISFFASSLFNISFTTLFSYQQKKFLMNEFLSSYVEKRALNKKAFLIELKSFLLSYNYYALANYKSVLEKNKNAFLLKRSKDQLERFISELK